MAKRSERDITLDKGHPRTGKAILLRYIITEIEQRLSNPSVVASFFFHGRGADIEKNALGLFRSLLYQILTQLPYLLEIFGSVFQDKVTPSGLVLEWHK